jgi:hypothetical protein
MPISLSRRGNKSFPQPVTTLLRRFRQPPGFQPAEPFPHAYMGFAAMPLLLGSTIVVCTLFSMMLGQIAMSMEAVGVLLAAFVLMTVQRE